jgi:hypothetical protein
VMRSRVSFFLISLAVAAAFSPASGVEYQNVCPVTKAPEHPFIPPAPFDAHLGSDGGFPLGTPELWAFVNTRWPLYLSSNKPGYFSEIYWQQEHREANPQLTVIARRLDAAAPLVWAKWANGAGPSHLFGRPPDSGKPGFITTSLRIPEAGCWEISAHYTPGPR